MTVTAPPQTASPAAGVVSAAALPATDVLLRSHPSLPLTLAALGVVAVGSVLPATPLAHTLGFRPLPVAFFAAPRLRQSGGPR
jgi:hypothetical protein